MQIVTIQIYYRLIYKSYDTEYKNMILERYYYMQ